MHELRACGAMVNVQGRSLLTQHHLQGLPGLSQSARDGLLAVQPTAVLDALRVPGVGRKTTARLLALGLLRDPHGVQNAHARPGRQGSVITKKSEAPRRIDERR
jgi:hypothetical protein